MRVNFGCGDRYVSGWINVDHAGSPHQKDQVVDLTGPLPWPDGTVTYVYAGHVLEHLDPYACYGLLDRLLDCMAPGGQIMIVGPDVVKAEQMIADGTFDFTWGHTLESIIHGGHRWPGDEHRWPCDAQRVMVMLETTGWTDITDVGITGVSAEWPVADRAPLWQCAISARRGDGR